MAGFWVYQHRNNSPDPSYFPVAASQTFDSGDPLDFTTNQLVASPKDGTKVLDTEFFCIAAEAARGNQSATRANLDYGNGPAGNTENRMVAVYLPQPGLVLATDNFWTSATGATAGTPIGADIGDQFQICSAAAGNWGLCDVAGVDADDAVARCLAILDVNGNAIDADNTTDGVRVIFEIVGTHQYGTIA